jgi:hypothetical protein
LSEKDIQENVTIQSFISNDIKIGSFASNYDNNSISYVKIFFPVINNFRIRSYSIDFDIDMRLTIFNNDSNQNSNLVAIYHFPSDLYDNYSLDDLKDNSSQSLGLFDQNNNKLSFSIGGLGFERNFFFPIDNNLGNLTLIYAFKLSLSGLIDLYPELNNNSILYQLNLHHSLRYENVNLEKVTYNTTSGYSLKINDNTTSSYAIKRNNGFLTVDSYPIYDNLRSEQFLLDLSMISILLIMQVIIYYYKRKRTVQNLVNNK